MQLSNQIAMFAFVLAMFAGSAVVAEDVSSAANIGRSYDTGDISFSSYRNPVVAEEYPPSEAFLELFGEEPHPDRVRRPGIQQDDSTYWYHRYVRPEEMVASEDEATPQDTYEEEDANAVLPSMNEIRFAPQPQPGRQLDTGYPGPLFLLDPPGTFETRGGFSPPNEPDDNYLNDAPPSGDGIPPYEPGKKRVASEPGADLDGTMHSESYSYDEYRDRGDTIKSGGTCSRGLTGLTECITASRSKTAPATLDYWKTSRESEQQAPRTEAQPAGHGTEAGDEGVQPSDEGVQSEGGDSSGGSSSTAVLADSTQGGGGTATKPKPSEAGEAPKSTGEMRNTAPDEPTLAEGQAARGL